MNKPELNQIFAEYFLQILQGVKHVCLNRADRAPDDIGDFLVRQLLINPEN